MINRREFLTTSSGLIIGTAIPSILVAQAKENKQPIYAGWLPNKYETYKFKRQQKTPYFSQVAKQLSDTGVGKQAFLWKFFEIVTNGPLIPHDQAIGDCLAADAIVLGEHIKPVKQIRVGDKVWTGEGKLSKVVSTRQIKILTPCIKIYARGMMPIICTPDHKFLVYRLGTYSNHKISSHSYQQYVNSGHKTLSCFKTYENRKPVWVKAEDLTEDDCLLTPKKIATIKSPLASSGDFFWGYFLGAGYAGGRLVELTLNEKHTELLNKLTTIIQKLGYKFKISKYKNRHALRIRIHSTNLVKILKQQFYTGTIKHFPGWAVGNQEFLNGLKAADGWTSGHENGIDSTSLSIIQGVNLSLIKLGYTTSIHDVRGGKGVYPNSKPLKRIIWYNNPKKHYVWSDELFLCRYVKKVEYIEGPTTVYDIGIQDTHHSFLANSTVVHNCVSHAFGLATDILDAIQVAHGRGAWQTKCATEIIYAGGRVEIGNGILSNYDGMYGSWGARWCNEYGILLRQPYLDGKYDFTIYSGAKARKWGHKCQSCTPWGGGVPDELEPLAKEHPVKTTTLITSWEQVRDSIYNGYPVTVGSDYGFTNRRDRDGFLRRSGKWYHDMVLAGIDDTGSRPGGLFINSWGATWLSGPTRFDQPLGSFWVDADVIDGMVKQEDSFAISNYYGYPRQNLDYKLY